MPSWPSWNKKAALNFRPKPPDLIFSEISTGIFKGPVGPLKQGSARGFAICFATGSRNKWHEPPRFLPEVSKAFHASETSGTPLYTSSGKIRTAPRSAEDANIP